MMYDACHEAILYQNGRDNEMKSTGAAYRLLQRTPGAGGRALCLRKSSIASGVITEAEWNALREHLHAGVRSFTLIPTDIAVKAAIVFGESEASAAFVGALGYITLCKIRRCASAAKAVSHRTCSEHLPADFERGDAVGLDPRALRFRERAETRLLRWRRDARPQR